MFIKGSVLVGAGLALAAGGVLLSRSMMKKPKLGGAPDMSEVNWFTAKNGAPCPYPMGRECIIDGHIIYMKKPWTGGGSQPAIAMGKGGGSRPAVAPVVRYYTHVGCAFSVGKVINNLDKVKADGKVVYNDVQEVTISGGWGVEYGTYGFAQYYIAYVDISSGDGDELAVGAEIAFTGFTNSANNGTWTVVKISEGLCAYGSKVGYRVWVRNSSFVTESSSTGTKTGEQGFPDWTPSANSGTVYDGSVTQTKNTTITGDVGAATVSAYRGTSYLVLDTFELTDFGHRLPRLTTHFAANDPDTYNVADCVAELAERHGLTGAYDVTGIDDEPLYQYITWGPISGVNALEPVMTAYDIIAQDQSGVVHFYNRKNAPVTAPHPIECMGVREEGSDAVDAAYVEQLEKKDLPSLVQVSFLDRDADGKEDCVNSQRSIFGIRHNIEQVDLPISMTRAKAKSIADRFLWTRIEASERFKTTVPENYFYYQPGDVVPFTALGQEWQILITNKHWGNNGIIELEGIPQRLYTLEHSEEYPSGGIPAASVKDHPFSPPEIQWKIFDHAPLHDEHAGTPGLYVFASGPHPERPFKGAVLMSSDDGADYTSILTISAQSVMGTVMGDELGGGVQPSVFDRASSFYVMMFNGELESVTEGECLAGANRFLVGDEVIGACNCVLQDTGTGGPRIYKLTKFLRGLRNTESEIDGHSAEEYCVHLNSQAGVHFVPLNHKVHKKDRYYKCVSSYGDPTDYSGVAHTHALGTVMPFSPYYARGSRDGSNNLTITWGRRTRMITRAFAERCPLKEPFERYEVDVYDGSAVVRTIEVSEATTASYTAAQQTADGLTPGDPVDLKIYQVSALLGRGREYPATV